jgi:hypothetical protein
MPADTPEPYTPSMERIEDMYSCAYAWRTRDGETEDGEPETDLSKLRNLQRAEFRCALAAHDREVAERAFDKALDAAQGDLIRHDPNYKSRSLSIIDAVHNPYRLEAGEAQ